MMMRVLLVLFAIVVLQFALLMCDAQTSIPIRNRYSGVSGLTLATNAQLPLNASLGRSYAFWINPAAVTADWTHVFTKSTDSYNNFDDRRPSLFMIPSGTRFHFVSDTSDIYNSVCDSVSSPPLNQWTHAAFVHSALTSPSTVTIYINGAVEANCSLSGSITSNTASLVSNQGYTFFNGAVADLRYYAGVYSQAEIQAIMAESKTAVDTTPPTMQLVSISSTPSPAVVGGTVTLTFNSSEAITVPTVTIFGRAATVIGNALSRRWTATTIIQGTDNLAATVPFSISNYFDYLNGNAGTTVTAVTDGSFIIGGCNTTYSPAFFANLSGITSGLLNLAFVSPASLTQTTFSFVGSSNSACHSTSNTYWNSTFTNSPACSYLYNSAIPLNFALANCNFLRDESDTLQTVYSSVIRAVTVQSVSTNRGMVLNRTLETSVNVRVSFSTAINVTSAPLTVYGPRITLARVVSTSFNPITYDLSLLILSSVQSPYQLSTPSLASVSGFTIVSVQPQTAESGQPTVAVCANSITSPCTQYWSVVIRRTTSCSPAPTTLNNNGWLLSFAVKCHSTFTGSCATVDPNTDAISFDTASDNYCPVLLDTESASATLTAFDSNAFTNQQSSFVFGARTHFRAVVSAPINIQALRLERVTIVSGGASGVSVLYTSPFTNANAYFSQAPVVTYNNHPAGYTGTFASAPTLMSVSDNQAGASNLQRVVTFSWIWSGATSSAASDSAVATIVSADLRVRYANQSTVAEDHIITLKWSPSHHNRQHLLAGTSALAASAAVSVVGTDATNNNNNGDDTTVGAPSTPSSSASVTTTNIVIAAVGLTVAMVAIVAIVSMVAKERQRNNIDKLQEIAMSTTASTQQLTQHDV